MKKYAVKVQLFPFGCSYFQNNKERNKKVFWRCKERVTQHKRGAT